MDRYSCIFVAGHINMVGSTLVRARERASCPNIATRLQGELDLLNQRVINIPFLRSTLMWCGLRPDSVESTGMPSGALPFSTRTSSFSPMSPSPPLRPARRNLVFFGPSRLYPRDRPQPIKEEYLLKGGLEETNGAYPIAKVSFLKMCDAFNRQYHTSNFSVTPTNLYGSNDNYDFDEGDVLAALIRKARLTKIKTSMSQKPSGERGKPPREFLDVGDLASAVLALLLGDTKGGFFFNIGTRCDITIASVACLVRDGRRVQSRFVLRSLNARRHS
jgi:GDP-L-fucose synthase